MRHIVYIIGAGLTKSLEQNLAVPLMCDFVAVLAKYLSNDDGSYDNLILKTLAELERSGVFENASEEGSLLAERVMTSRVESLHESLSGEQLERFKEIMATRPAENVELLLQRAIKQAAEVHDEFSVGFLPQQFNFAINRVFSRISWNVRLHYLEKFLSIQFALPDTKHTFISFNYDLILDACIQRQKQLPWNAKTGYGFTAERFITLEDASEHMKQFEGAGGHFSFLPTRELNSILPSEGSIAILKPHGSLNWLLGFNENYKFIDASPILCLTSGEDITHYPRFDCQHLQLTNEIGWDLSDEKVWANAGLFLLPPAESKVHDNEFLNKIRDQQAESYADADEVFVIGWSMPPTDENQFEIIQGHIGMRQTPIESLTVINWHAPKEYYDRVTSAFGIQSVRTKFHNDGFCQYASEL